MLEGSDEKPQQKMKSHGESRKHPLSEGKVVSNMEQEVHVWVHAQRHTIAPETLTEAPLFIYISIHSHTTKTNVPVEAHCQSARRIAVTSVKTSQAICMFTVLSD